MKKGLVLLGILVVLVGFWATRPRYGLADLGGKHALDANRWLEEQGEAAIPLLMRGLDHPDGSVRARCVRQLEFLGAPEAAPGCVARLRDADLNVRTIAARSLVRQRGWASAEPLLDRLRDPREDSRVRGYLLEALGRANERQGIPYAVQSAGDRQASFAERLSAVRSLMRWRAVEGEAVLHNVLREQDAPPRLRRAAGMALGRLQSPSGYELLANFLGGPPGDVDGYSRAGAALGLGGADAASLERVRPILLKMAADASMPTLARAAAAHTLLERGSPVPAGFLRDLLLTDKDPEVRRLAAETIPLTHDEALWDSLYDSLDKERNHMVWSTVQRSLTLLP